jgi:hypothetical protein
MINYICLRNETKMNTIDPIISLAILLFAALIHAFFQLSISVLTLLSGHSLGRKTAHRRLVNLSTAFITGAAAMTFLLLSAFAWVFDKPQIELLLPALWTITSGAAIGVGISVWLFYNRKNQGTSLWIPRPFARFLHDRAKHGQNVAEAFGLGMTSVFGEIIFVFAPLSIAALIIIQTDVQLQLLSALVYTGVSILPLLIVGVMICRGHKLSHIQRWRESNKRFIQFSAGFGLVIIGLYIFVEQVLTSAVRAPGI